MSLIINIYFPRPRKIEIDNFKSFLIKIKKIIKSNVWPKSQALAKVESHEGKAGSIIISVATTIAWFNRENKSNEDGLIVVDQGKSKQVPRYDQGGDRKPEEYFNLGKHR